MDIARINSVLEKAIVAFQSEEIDMLWEKFKVPTPKQMQKKYGMELSLSADDAMKGIDSALYSLVGGHGKLTDPNRTPSRKEVVAALNEFIEVSKRMAPKDRKEALARLRDWQKLARAHAKRLQQASSSYRAPDVSYKHLAPARAVRDDIGEAIKIVSKFRGGGFMKAGTKAAPGTGKKRPSQKKKTAHSDFMKWIAKDDKENQERLRKGYKGKYTVGDATVGTFINILEANLHKIALDQSSYIDKSDFQVELNALKSVMSKEMGSDDKRDLKDLIRMGKKAFAKQGALDYVINDWVEQIQTYIKSGKMPFAPGGTVVRPQRDKRQMGLKFEALRRLRLALVG